MRSSLLILAILVLGSSAAPSAELRLRRATLTLGGVGTFEYEAPVAPDGTVTLNVRRSDVDDVLKSLTVLDGSVRVRGLSLIDVGSSARAFAELPFPADALADPLTLLNELRGVPLQVRDNSGREVILEGRLVTAVRSREEAGAVKEGLERTRVTLFTESGMRQIVLEETGGIRVVDPQLHARLEAALEALRGEPAGDRRVVTLHIESAGEHPIRVVVVTAAPLWKATYRLSLPVQDETVARLQGWATLENATASDWERVAVSLQSGNPITFRQQLYGQINVERPDIPVDQQARPAPQVDQGFMASPAPSPPRPAAAFASSRSAAKEMAAPADQAVQLQAIASTTFELSAPVSLPTGSTASLPFVDVSVSAQPVSVLDFDKPHPLAAVRLSNPTNGTLPGGAVSTFENRRFAGDAILAPMPAGAQRLLTFAEDAAVSAQWHQGVSRDVVGLTAFGGVAHLTRRQRTTTLVELSGAANTAKTVWLGIPKVEGATLELSGGELVEQSASIWRVRVLLPPAGQVVVTATADRLVSEDLGLTTDPEAVLRLRGLDALSGDSRQALDRIAELQQSATQKDSERDQFASRRAAIAADEQRLRDNLSAVPQTSPLHGRLLQQLDAAETELQDLAAQGARADTASREAHDAVSSAISRLSIGG